MLVFRGKPKILMDFLKALGKKSKKETLLKE